MANKFDSIINENKDNNQEITILGEEKKTDTLDFSPMTMYAEKDDLKELQKVRSKLEVLKDMEVKAKEVQAAMINHFVNVLTIDEVAEITNNYLNRE